MDVVNRQLGSLTSLTGEQAGTTFHITKPVCTLGRELTNDLVLSDPSISRHHAQIALTNGTWIITKLAPQNTISVNNRDTQQARLNDKDVIGLGTSITLRFQVLSSNVGRVPPAFNNNGVQAAPLRQNPQPVAYPGVSPVAPPPPLAPNAYVSTQQAPDHGNTMAQALPSLEVTANTDNDKKVYPLPPTKQVFNIGRDPSNDIVINRPTVSGFHAQIIREGNSLVIVHPHPQKGTTANGLSYNGQVYRGSTPFRKPLVRGDFFRIADEHGTFVTLTYNDGSGAVQEAVPEIKPFQLIGNVVTIGRAPDNMVVLNHPQVSGHHARLEKVGNDYKIVDLGSTNHVYVGVQLVRDQVLRVGNEIRIGPFKLTYTGTQLTQQDERSGIRIDALHVSKAVGNEKTIIINDVSFAIPARSFVAIVGGSGAGKSTLMDTLNGLRPAQQGKVLYNGQDYYQNLASFSTQLGYVPQDDIIHRDLTVERALYYAAKLRLPSDFTEKQIRQRIDDVLSDVEMTFRRKVLVSKLSGGQRKRVSIALELLADPNVFFLDEPTSGLDPGLDRKMMQLLRTLADRGRTIVLVTHATNNIKSCDFVCFLCRGGRLAYFGPPDEAKAYFGKSDFAEIYSTLEPPDDTSRIPQEAEARFRQSADFIKYVDEPLRRESARIPNAAAPVATVKQPKRGNPWKQFALLSSRYLELLGNDVGNLLILLLQAPVIGIILFLLTNPMAFSVGDTSDSLLFCPPHTSTISGQSVSYNNCTDLYNLLQTDQGQQYAQQNGGVDALMSRAEVAGGGNAETTLFIIAFAAVMFGCINGAREIVKEAPIYKRERTVNLGIVPYMFSKIIVLGILCLAQSLVLAFLVSLKAPFPHSTFLPPFLEIYITMALTSLAGLMLGLTVSALVPNNDRAMSIVPLVLIPQVIFSGIIFKLNNPILQFLGAFFPARWAMAAMGSSVGIHGNLIQSDNFSFQGTLYSGIGQGAAVFHLFLCWFFLILTIFILGGLIAYFLKKKDVRG
ncbi:MAG: FHA domain-containing protein [Ktedonobacteraceae bacterium]